MLSVQLGTETSIIAGESAAQRTWLLYMSTRSLHSQHGRVARLHAITFDVYSRRLNFTCHLCYRQTGASAPRVLEAVNRTAAGGRQHAVVTCSIGARQVWQDEAASHVVAAAGTINFAAVALQNGFLQVCRRRRTTC